jgi:NADH dehydrogenase
LRNQDNARVLMGEVTEIDATNHHVTLRDGTEVAYDMLVVAAGASHSYMGNPQWERNAPGLKNLGDALEIRKRVLNAYEAAERTTDPAEQAAWLTFVVVGSGPTGVEQAGALGELAHLSLKRNFRNFNPNSARILLVDLADRILPAYPADLAEKAAHSLQKLGVTVKTGARVVDISSDAITLERDGEREVIPTHTVLWAAGVQASPLAKMLADATGAETDRAGRIIVNADLSLPNQPEILALGDIAHYAWDRGISTETSLPATAPVAMQQGDYAAEVIKARVAGLEAPLFQFKDRGQLATIGRNAAVGKVFGIKVSGYVAWLAWLFIHLMHLVGFDNRLLVFFQWFWNYITFHRGARLIVERERPVTEDRRKPAASGIPVLQKV